jgi:hypothetical protein
MRKQSISTEDATAILSGRAPEARPDLEVLVSALDDFRLASFEAPPQPSAELAALLDAEQAPRFSPSLQRAAATKTARNAWATAWRRPTLLVRRSRLIGWIAGLSLAAKISVGATAAAVGVVGAGAAEVLPAPAQEVFDEVLTAVTPFDRSDEVRNDDGRGEAGREAAELKREEALKRAEEARQAATDKREEALKLAEEARQAAADTRDEALKLAEEARLSAESMKEEAHKLAEQARQVGAEIRGGVGVGGAGTEAEVNVEVEVRGEVGSEQGRP